MKQNAIIFMFIGLIWSTPLFAQQIISTVILPGTPDTNDFLLVEVSTFFTTADCPVVDSLSEITIINDTVRIKAVHNLGPMTTLCNSIDTFQVGYLTVGTYYLKFELYSYGSPTMLANRDTVFTVVPVTSVGEIVSDFAEIKLFPNPTTGQITLTNLPQETTRITVYNVLGELAYDQPLTGSNEPELDLSALSDGLYLIQVQYGQIIDRQKVIKH